MNENKKIETNDLDLVIKERDPSLYNEDLAPILKKK